MFSRLVLSRKKQLQFLVVRFLKANSIIFTFNVNVLLFLVNVSKMVAFHLAGKHSELCVSFIVKQRGLGDFLCLEDFVL